LLRSKYNIKFIEVDDFAYFNKASMPQGLCGVESLTTITKTIMSDAALHAHVIPADIMYYK
jgi:hypothetical protein